MCHKVFQIVAAPLIKSALIDDTLHILVSSLEQDTDSPYLVVSNFAC